MPTTQFLPFGTAAVGVANTLTPSAYAALTSILANGFQTGIANSTQVNTALRQATTSAAALAKFATDYGLLDCLDNADHGAFSLAIRSAIEQILVGRHQDWSPGDLKLAAYYGVPVGWLKANGAVVNVADYPNLYAAIATLYNQTILPPTQFQLPDYRGVFGRGIDDGRGLDPGRGFATFQTDDIKSHTHPLSDTILTEGVLGVGPGGTTSGSSGVPVATGATGGTETRPVNLPWLVLIKT